MLSKKKKNNQPLKNSKIGECVKNLKIFAPPSFPLKSFPALFNKKKLWLSPQPRLSQQQKKDNASISFPEKTKKTETSSVSKLKMFELL